MFFTIGSKEYITTMIMAGLLPMPKKGIKSPRSAMEGTACITFIKPIMGFLMDLIFVISIPSGTPISIAAIIAQNVRVACWNKRLNI